MSWTPERLLGFLDELEIAHRTVEHAAVFTVDEARRLRGELPGGHSKSLFLRDKKGRMLLVTMRADDRADLGAIAEQAGTRRLSFGSPERLRRHLGVSPGAVSPFAAVNDGAGAVAVWLDGALMGEEVLWLHPLVNTRSTAVDPADLVRFLDAVGHPAGFLSAGGRRPPFTGPGRRGAAR